MLHLSQKQRVFLRNNKCLLLRVLFQLAPVNCTKVVKKAKLIPTFPAKRDRKTSFIISVAMYYVFIYFDGLYLPKKDDFF